MSVIRVGSSSQYAENWAAIFGGTMAKKAKKVATKAAKAVNKKPAKKKAAKKKASAKRK